MHGCYLCAYAALQAPPVRAELILKLEKGLGLESICRFDPQNVPFGDNGIAFRGKLHQETDRPFTVILKLPLLSVKIENRHRGIYYQRSYCKNTQAFRASG